MNRWDELYEKHQGCTCWVHRYTVAHVCGCGALVDHSQGAWNEHRLHRGEWVTFPSYLVEHDDTREQVLEKVAAWRADTAKGGRHGNK